MHLTVRRRFTVLRCNFHVFAAALFVLCVAVHAQELRGTSDPSNAIHPIVPDQPSSSYVPPSESTKFHNYLYDAFGPYPFTMTAFVAGYHQATRNPPEWREGVPGYFERYGSDFGTSAAGVTARYLAAEALHEDTLYYRCACRGFWSRLQHAIASTLIARRGDDGHKVFAVPALIEPYAASFTAVYGWYPPRFGAKDAFRMGNYGLLEYAAGNISLEFLPSITKGKGSSWVARFHLDNRHAAREGESAP
jgi:hypothetical protein